MPIKIIKPLKLGLLFRTFEAVEKRLFCVSVLAFAPFEGKSLLETEPNLWNTLSTEMGKEMVIDVGMPKPRSEILLTGNFFASQGRPVSAGRVRAVTGDFEKTLYVFGNRYWRRTRVDTWTISDPEPMKRMGITYANAFGGLKYAKNPLGKGMEPVTLDSGETLLPLPNIELPDRLVASRKDRPEPAGFGPLDITWPQRNSKAGTYDQKWLKERFPGFAEDMDWTIFNTAPEDQQLEGLFAGDEKFSFENMHPEKPLLEGRLPGITSRCFVEQVVQGNAVFKEIPTRLDTVWFFPHIEKTLLIFRGTTEVADEDAEDIVHLLAACERMGDSSRSPEHYKKALEKRTDEDTGHLNILDESDLLPEGEASSIPELMSSQPAGEDVLRQNMANRMKREEEKAIKKMEELGLDPKDIIKDPEPAPAIDMNNLAELPKVVERLEKKAEQSRKQMEAHARQMLEEQGLDMETLQEQARKNERRWPKFSAQETIDRLRQFGIEGPGMETKLREAEEQVNAALRLVSHHVPASYIPDEEELEQRKALILEALNTGESLADRDLAYVNLSGLDLSGMNLAKAYLEGAKMAGTNLENADLTGAILVRVQMDGANLKGARLREANLGHARVSACDFSGAVLNKAVLAEAQVEGTIIEGGDMDGTDFTKARVKNTIFDRSSLREAMLMETSFVKTQFRGCDLSEAIFLYTILDECDFSEAIVVSATFVKVPAEKTIFRKANLTDSCMTDQSGFSNVDFSGAILSGANLRGTDLKGADFMGADLTGADLSQCPLSGANFMLSVAKKTQFVKADLTHTNMEGMNLMEGSLQKAILFDTNLRSANLYGVDFLKAKFRNTEISGANLKKAFLDRWIKE